MPFFARPFQELQQRPLKGFLTAFLFKVFSRPLKGLSKRLTKEALHQGPYKALEGLQGPCRALKGLMRPWRAFKAPIGPLKAL